jgi:nucleoside-diphosphate-sugar epimerase
VIDVGSLYDSIVITGAGGMLAYALKQTLGARGLTFSAVTRQEWDITDAPQVELMFEDYRPTLVLNCAAYTKVDLAEKETDVANKVNGEGPGNLATLCRKHGAKLVHYSTDYVFDGTLRRTIRSARRARTGNQSFSASRRSNAPPGWIISSSAPPGSTAPTARTSSRRW